MLRGQPRVWIGTHVDPDGDAIGSSLGLGALLEDLRCDVTLACADKAPAEIAFLPGLDALTSEAPSDQDVLVALDAADASRLGALYDPSVWSAARTIVIDHHVSNPGFGEVNVIDTHAASTAEILVSLAEVMGSEPSPEAATCLLTGIITDTIGFRTSNTSASTLDAARSLMEHGAKLADITQAVFYMKPIATLRLVARAIDRLEMHGPFAITTLRRSDLTELSVSAEAMRGVTAVVSTAAEPAAVALLRERRDGTIDVSLRSKPGVDVVPAASSLGGGGHPQASGARIEGPIEEAAVAVLEAMQAHIHLPNHRGPRTESDPGLAAS